MPHGWRERNLDRLASLSATRGALATALLLAVVATLDWFSPARIAATIGYLLPISLAAWSMGRLAAHVTAGAAAACWLLVDLLTQGDIATTDEIVDLVTLTVAFQLFGLLLATLREQLDKERQLAYTDPLTAVHNRRAFWSATARELARARRYGTPFSLAYIDIDGFKGVNDRYGHHAGDEVLRRLAVALQEDLRELDMVARLGGDEFVVLLPNADEQAAGKVMMRQRKQLAKAAWRQPFDIDFSIGVLTVLEAPKKVESIVARADQLMYQVKRSGRGMVLFDVLRGAGDDCPPTEVMTQIGLSDRVAN